jgi:transcription elongation GreA/GreB family factor
MIWNIGNISSFLFLMSLKQKTYDKCLQAIEEKLQELKASLALINESSNNETKSTAGDKHETAKAMMQLEQEKLGRQLKELLDQKQELEKLDIRFAHSTVGKGSLIKTDKGYLFIAIGLGKIKTEEETVITISFRSPLAQKLLGLKVNEEAEINGINYRIEAIL